MSVTIRLARPVLVFDSEAILALYQGSLSSSLAPLQRCALTLTEGGSRMLAMTLPKIRPIISCQFFCRKREICLRLEDILAIKRSHQFEIRVSAWQWTGWNSTQTPSPSQHNKLA